MAGDPSPSGSSRRRLSELLDQQQEPFSLDLFLIERGCSPGVLEASSGAWTCWLWPRTRTPVRPAANKKASCRSGVLRLLLCKLLRGKITPATASKKQQLRLSAVDRPCVYDGEKRRRPGDHENSVPPARAAEARTEKVEEEVEDDDGSNKRLSPVSVLEQRTLEQSPPAHEQKAFLVFSKLLHAAYSPALLVLAADAIGSTRRPSKNSKTSRTETLPAAVAARNNHAHWVDVGDVFEEALAEATGVIASELAGGARAAWPGDLQQERRDVGADIAGAVLDTLVEEMVAELLMGTDGRDFAVDTARQHCWVSGG